MRRRKFLGLTFGTAAVWPMAGYAQQALPVVGFLSGRSAAESEYVVAAFAEGLRETGFIVGQNVALEFRWADGHYQKLPEYAAELVARRVAAIAAVGAVPAARAAQAATKTIPIVFVTSNPVEIGLVASLSRPGGNLTGISSLAPDLEAKRLQILRELVPSATAITFYSSRPCKRRTHFAENSPSVNAVGVPDRASNA